MQISSTSLVRSELRPGRMWPWLLVVWTAIVWGGRIRLADGASGPLLLALTFLAPALVLAVCLACHSPRVPNAVGALAAWTVAVWVVRVPGIALGGHPIPFLVVHVVLAVVSVSVAAVALRAVLAT
ncbi:MAG: hypothetical protein ACKOYM_09210 [Actinomycetes bacterium]